MQGIFDCADRNRGVILGFAQKIWYVFLYELWRGRGDANA